MCEMKYINVRGVSRHSLAAREMKWLLFFENGYQINVHSKNLVVVVVVLMSIRSEAINTTAIWQYKHFGTSSALYYMVMKRGQHTIIAQIFGYRDASAAFTGNIFE
jgi:hypothetical protein